MIVFIGERIVRCGRDGEDWNVLKGSMPSFISSTNLLACESICA